MSNYVRDVENLIMVQDTDDLVMDVQFTGREHDNGVDVLLEAVLELHDGTKQTHWVCMTDGELFWEDEPDE